MNKTSLTITKEGLTMSKNKHRLNVNTKVTEEVKDTTKSKDVKFT